jgi:hypothetical protein
MDIAECRSSSEMESKNDENEFPCRLFYNRDAFSESVLSIVQYQDI